MIGRLCFLGLIRLVVHISLILSKILIKILMRNYRPNK